MEAIITIVGFLGAGKTTLLKQLTTNALDLDWNPFIILNDYENAALDANQFLDKIPPKAIKPLTGSCICCSGIHELRNSINRIPERAHGITLIEANGTSDACSLMEFLGVGLDDRFLPPVQISVVDVNNWQKRGEHNELEVNQIQVSSLIVLTHTDNTTTDRQTHVIQELKTLNPYAEITTMSNINITFLSELLPSKNTPQKLEHLKAHWSSCSCDLPNVPNTSCIHDIFNKIPKSILRVKGCTIIGNDKNYTYFERKPDGEIFIRPFNGEPTTGAKLLTIGAGSNVDLLEQVIKEVLSKV